MRPVVVMDPAMSSDIACALLFIYHPAWSGPPSRCSLTAGTARRTAQVDGFKMRWTQVGGLRSFTKAARRCWRRFGATTCLGSQRGVPVSQSSFGKRIFHLLPRGAQALSVRAGWARF